MNLLRTLFEWQIEKLLFDEAWEFKSSCNVPQLKQRLVDASARLNLNDIIGHGRISIVLENDHITIHAPHRKFVNFMLPHDYFFSGNLIDGLHGATIKGTFRTQNFRRFTSLFILNFTALFCLIPAIILVVLFVKFVEGSSPDAEFFQIGLVFIGSVGFAFIVNCFDRLISKFEKIGRSRIYGFLQERAQKQEA